MKKPVNPIETSSQKSADPSPVNADDPIIHHDDPEPSENIHSFTDLPEKLPASDWSETEDVSTAVSYKELKITSPAFANNETIPAKYTCDGINVNPPLEVDNIPPDAKCLALIVDDPDAPGSTFVHWLAWNIPITHLIKENEIHGIQGVNDYHTNEYKGPCPPSGIHRYFFKIYALNSLLDLKPNTDKQSLETTMSKYIIGFGQLVGTYQRNK